MNQEFFLQCQKQNYSDAPIQHVDNGDNSLKINMLSYPSSYFSSF